MYQVLSLLGVSQTCINMCLLPLLIKRNSDTFHDLTLLRRVSETNISNCV